MIPSNTKEEHENIDSAWVCLEMEWVVSSLPHQMGTQAPVPAQSLLASVAGKSADNTAGKFRDPK